MTKNFKEIKNKDTINGYVYVKNISYLKKYMWHTIQGSKFLSHVVMKRKGGDLGSL